MNEIKVTIGGNAITMTKDQAREISAALAAAIEEGKEPEVAWPYELEYLDNVDGIKHFGVRREMSDGEKPGIGTIRCGVNGDWYGDDMRGPHPDAHSACIALWESERRTWPDGQMEMAGFTLENYPTGQVAWELELPGYTILLHGGAGEPVPSIESDQFWLEVLSFTGDQVEAPAVIAGRTNALTVVDLLRKVLGQ